MKTEQKMVLAAAIACGLTLLSYLATGCNGDDDSNCMSTENCPGTDAGMKADADQMAPDANTTPDTNPDPCAVYSQYSGQTWRCETSGGPTDFPVLLEEYNGTCAVAMWEACQNPPLEDMAAGELTCTTFAGHIQHCWRP